MDEKPISTSSITFQKAKDGPKKTQLPALGCRGDEQPTRASKNKSVKEKKKNSLTMKVKP
uniref:Uncharacterized protein n=1 Tax=Rhizophora mucronata TaxID=61149 RepID=A0A2P2MHU8_RHIMU